MKKVVVLVLSLLLFMSALVPNTSFAKEACPISQKAVDTCAHNKIYVPKNYYTASPRRTRGFCTDNFSWEWCKAHGYANNRPVMGKVKLVQREVNCMLEFDAKLTALGIKTLITGNLGEFFTLPRIAFQLWNCLF